MMNCYDISSDEEEDFVKNKDRVFVRKVTAQTAKDTPAHSKVTPFNVPTLTNPPASLRVGYVFSQNLLFLCDKMAQIRGRAGLVHALIESYGLLRTDKVKILHPRPATYDDLVSFHDSSFVKYLRSINVDVDEDDDVDEQGEGFGLMYDCPPVKRIYDFVLRNVGASLIAARALVAGDCGVAVNWFGGWHHAQRDCAAGFCYANDVVIAIQELKKKFNRVLYVDLDLHHGDGVQEAFRHTDSVATVSLHKFEAGFFPGTGAVDEVGFGKGVRSCFNVPLKDGITDDKYSYVFEKVMALVTTTYAAGALVIQCGADGIFGDPHRAFNLTPCSLVHCVRWLVGRCAVPTLLLGGGGYHHANTARCWTLLTAAMLEQEIPEDVPEDCPHFEQFGPDFTVSVTPGYVTDGNSIQYLDSIVGEIAKRTEIVKA